MNISNSQKLRLKPAFLILLAGLIVAPLAALAPVAALAASSNLERWKSQGWKTDFSKSSVASTEIFSGGPPRDGIPPIDKPLFKSITASTELSDHEPVISLEINGDARAYPLRVMTWHEIVNDQVGGVPVTVTFCPLCNTAIVFERRVGDQLLDFGTTGKLRHSDLVMYDRQSESWWQQFTGEAIFGKMTGTRLKIVASRLTSFERFSARHPKGRVLTPSNPKLRAYGQNPYADYDRRWRPYGLFRGEMPKGINPMARVIAIDTAEGPYAVSLELLRQKKSITKDNIILRWTAGQSTALGNVNIAQGRDIGNVTAELITGSGGKDAVYHLTFAFAFHAFHPKVPIQTK